MNQKPLLLTDFQPIAAIAPTRQALQTLHPLWASGQVALWIPAKLLEEGLEQPPDIPCHVYDQALRDVVAKVWRSHSALVFGLAAGAVVRLIAPLLTDKTSDPAVVVVDAEGQFVISLCGGHQGGADRLTQAIAPILQATPVLTGAAHAQRLPGVDVLGVPFGWNRGTGDWFGVSRAIAHGQAVQVHQTVGTRLWQAGLPAHHPFTDHPTAQPNAHLYISEQLPPQEAEPTVAWHPRVLWVGVGCERDTSQALIEQAIRQVFAAHRLSEGAIAGIASLDLKADEAGLLAVCGDRQLPLKCFAKEELRTIQVPNPSTVVDTEVGTPSVAEAAAILASHQAGASLDAPSQDLVPNPGRLRIPKHIVRHPDEPGAVTIAVAQAAREYTGRTGQIWLVGMGPGFLDQITPAAQSAIAQADGIIGYHLYVDLIQSMIRPGQIVETSPITQERQRAERAIALANWGLTVAVISSGDCGIYGMAGLVFEQLRAQGWDGKTPAVQVFPGITALQAAAARVGAPLMHDFCAISLSDLLTPWPQIETRLKAAAQADFVTALYNPRSRNRVQQVAIAQAIFLDHRDPQTPVALVRSAYRPDEQVILSTLADFLNHPVDMLTTVLIGNQTTRFHHQWMITPRGYLGFSPQKTNPNRPD